MAHDLQAPGPAAPSGGYSTRPLAPDRRIEGWTRAVSDRFVESSFLVREPEQFVASMHHRDLADVALTHFASAGHGVKRVMHSQRQAARAAEDFYIVCVQLEGTSQVEQDDRVARLVPGSLALVDTRRAYELSMSCDYRQAVLRVPRHRLDARMPHVTGHVATAVDADGAAALALHRTLAAIHTAPAPPAAAPDLADALLSLIAAGLRAADAPDAAPARVRAPRPVERAMQYLRAHLHEPHLGIEELARRLALSPSYLHLLFRAEGTTPMRWLWHARLLRGRELLADPRHAHRSITEIAFDLGFSDAAHFSRSFKALFGAKPSECRSPARITS